MSKLIISASSGGNADSDVLTSLRNDVLKGTTAITHDSDGEPIEGTLELTGNATEDDVVIDRTFYKDNPKVKGVGTLPIVTTGGTYWNRDLGVGLESDNFYSFQPYGKYEAYDSRGSLHRIPIARLQSTIGATAGKIVSGQSIAGVSGTATNDANANGGHILKGYTAYTKGFKQTGIIEDCGGLYITPTSYQQKVSSAWKRMTGDVIVNPIPSGVNVSFIDAGGKNNHSTYSGRSTNYNLVYPNGNFGTSKKALISDIKSQGISGLTLNEVARCYDFYFVSETPYYACDNFQIISRPIPCANAVSITATILAYGYRTMSTTYDENFYSGANVRLSYFNDNSTRIEENESKELIFMVGEGDFNHTKTTTIELNTTYKSTYKWVALSVSFYCTAYKGNGELGLGVGSGITDLYYTT